MKTEPVLNKVAELHQFHDNQMKGLESLKSAVAELPTPRPPAIDYSLPPPQPATGAPVIRNEVITGSPQQKEQRCRSRIVL